MNLLTLKLSYYISQYKRINKYIMKNFYIFMKDKPYTEM